MPVIEGLSRLRTKLNKLAKSRGSNASVIVGYTQNYALPVHENMTARHKTGNAKYLEGPARRLSNNGTLGKLVETTMKGGGTIEQGLMVAGLRLQRESQQEVPVDTGALKASAVTRKG